MRLWARACVLLATVMAVLAPAAVAVTVARTNKGPDNMPFVPVPVAKRAVSGYYEPLGQAPIATAHSLQLPCGNRFLMMVRVRACVVGCSSCCCGC